MPASQASPTTANSGTTTIIPPSAGTAAVPITYTLDSISSNLDIRPAASAGATQTFVTIRVRTDITAEIRVRAGVTAQIYFQGNVSVKARDIINDSNRAGNLQFYGVSPTNGTQQTIEINSPGNFAATFYAPTAGVDIRGNPDILGSVTCATYYGNGNTSVHYDRDLDDLGDVQDYYFASYIEDLR